MRNETFSMQPVPKSLKIVAYLFIVFGAFAAIDMVLALFNNRLSINLGAIGIFVGIGLLQLKQIWWKVAFFLICLGLVFTPIMLFFSFFRPMPVNFFSMRSDPYSVLPGILVSIFAFAITCWQYKVLNSPAVRQLFGR